MMKIFNRAGLTGIGFFVLLFAAIVMTCFDAHAADYPAVVAVTPADGDVRVSIDTTIVIQFDKQMDTYGVEDDMEVTDQFDNEIQGTFSWSTTVYTNDTVTFTPTQSLGYSLSYEIRIGAGFQDAVNHHRLNGYWGEDKYCYFATVGAPQDDSAPEVISVFPYNGQAGGNTHLIATFFTKPIDPVTATNLNVILSGPGISGYSVNCGYLPFPILMIEPDTPLALHGDYTVTLTTGLTDTEGHSLAAQYAWSFNTGAGDTIPPTVTQTVPANGAVDTRSWSGVKVWFSENMDPDSITTSTVTVYDETALEYKDIHIDKHEIDGNGNRSYITIKPVFDDRIWTDGHSYTVMVSQTVTDLAGNPLGADYVFTFTVIAYPGFAPDIRGFHCIGIRQPDGSTLIELELDADGAYGCGNLTVVATDLTQAGKYWTLTNDPVEWDFNYESTGDEGLDVGYHEIEFLVTDTINGHSTSIRSNFYIFNTAPSLAAPLDTSHNVSTMPLLSWNANGLVSDDIYRIVIFDGPDPNSANIVWGSFFSAYGSSSYSVKVPACRALDTNTTYYWAVFAADNHNQIQGIALSPIWSFTAFNEELAVDFGSNGIYHYDNGTWTWLSTSNPSGMENYNGDLVVDLDTFGIYLYNGTWTLLTVSNPEDMVTSVGTDLYADFGSSGLYKYDGTWTWLTVSNPEDMVAAGTNLYADFGSGGIYHYDNGTWTWLTVSNPEAMVAVGTNLYADFGSGGIYHYDNGTWTWLTVSNPEDMVAGSTGLYADFGSSGLYKYDGTWTWLTVSNPEDMVAAGTDLYADFGSSGLYKYDGTWTWLTVSNPEDMVAAGTDLYADFGSSGLYKYDGTWTWLTVSNPEDMVAVNINP